MNINEIGGILRDKFQNLELTMLENTSPGGVEVPAESLGEIMGELYENEHLFFDMLSCITGIDNGPDFNSMEVVYNLYSIPYDHSVTIKVSVDRNNPQVTSVAHIWQTALWHEREAFDLLGIQFTDHPDLRRILLPHDWEGHPLRKDYNTQDYYHGIKVDYE